MNESRKKASPHNTGDAFDEPPFDLPQAPAQPVAPKGPISARAMAASRPQPSYLEGLNAEQRQAVEETDGPLLVLAGAGTGKTRVLTTRIAHILAQNKAWPSQILAVTFTNKAAREMKERIGSLIGGAVEGMSWLGTFHSIGVKILRRHAELVGLKSGFTILDDDDTLRLLKQVIEAAGIDKERWPARQLASLIDGWKNRGLTPDKVPGGEAFSFAEGKGKELYAAYQSRLKDLNACDFGDLLLECLRLFREHPDVLAEYHKRFRYILVDEYQDTNVAQYLWLRLLAQGIPNVCCVGDDDQCLAAGTLVTMGCGEEKPIETIKTGDMVLSCFGSGDFRPAKVLRTYRKPQARNLVSLRLASGRTLTSTPEHTHFAGYRHGLTPQTYFVYLMQKRGVGFRLGTSQVYTKGQKNPVLGFKQRAVQEHADALWIVSAHASEPESRFEEMRLSLAYGLPTLPFTPRKGASKNGLVHDASAIARLYASVDTEGAAKRLMADFALAADEPHHQAQSRNASRRNVVLTLCGDRRGTTPMHRLSIVGNDSEGAAALHGLGFSVRSAKAGSESWRVETAKAGWREIAADVERMRGAFDLNIIRQARLGADNSEGEDQRVTNSLPFRRAASIRPGMAMFTRDGYDVVVGIETQKAETEVVDIDVEATHNFLGNGIVTHNSIYGWRGAEVENILKFDKDFPGARVIRLERNYRSTSHILAAASGLIAKNEGRLGKTLFTDSPGGNKVSVSSFWDDEAEARSVGDDIENLQRAHRDELLPIWSTLIGGIVSSDSGEIDRLKALIKSISSKKDTHRIRELIETGDLKISLHEVVRITQALAEMGGLNEIAVLVRASHQMRVIEDRFITLGLPYRVIGGPKFYERQEIKDAVAYLEVVANPANDLKFERIVNVPKRGIGDTTVKRIHMLARSRGMPMVHAAREMVETDELAGKTRKSLYDLLRSFDRWRALLDTMKHTDLAELILDESGYTAMWQADKSPQAQSRLENLKELVQFMHDFDSLAGFLEHVSLVMDVDNSSDGDRASLMTMHAAKGLEFDTVFLPGWEEGLFPHQRALDESGKAGLEEERRLAYVGLTRAKRMAKVSFAQNRRTHGLYQSAIPSRFVDELPEGDVDVVESASPYGGVSQGYGYGNPFGASRFDKPGAQNGSGGGSGGRFSSNYQTPGWQRAQQTWSRADDKKKKKQMVRGPRTIEGELVAASSASAPEFKAGTRVTHEKFGEGTVTLVDGNKLTILFDDGETKRVVASFVEKVG